MKKHLLLAVFVIAPLVLAGCSFGTVSTTTTATPTANPNNSIWTSSDSGKTWLNNFLPNSTKVDISAADVLSMVIDPHNAKKVFVGTKGGGILKTEDGGNSWAYLVFKPEKVYGLDLDPLNTDIIYISGVWQKRGKVFKSMDSGATWTEIYTTASPGPLVISLVIDKKNPNTVYITTSDNQILETTDGGTSWKNIYEAQMPVEKIAIDINNSSLLYGITQDGKVLRSKDAGRSFEDLSKQLLGAQINGGNILEVDPANGNWVYLAGQAGMFRSKDAGETWEKIQILTNPQTFPVKALAINPTNQREIIYGAAQAAYRSIDGGANWETFQFNMAKSIKMIKYAVADPTNLYLGFSK